MLLAASGSGATSVVGLLLAVFAASMVEMVEALTIVVAVGTTRGWRSALQGALSALGVLGVLVGAGGTALVHYLPINTLRVAAGAVLLLLGLSWLRKAILRSAGLVARHDENQIFDQKVRSLAGTTSTPRRDPQGFAVAFKGVFVEGIEVVLIVIGLGASQHRIGWAALAAGLAALIVAGTGALVVRQLSEVPENLLKMVVGVMLTSFGTFWIGEGNHLHWPGSDLALVVFVAGFALLTVILVAWSRKAGAVAAVHRHVSSTEEIET